MESYVERYHRELKEAEEKNKKKKKPAGAVSEKGAGVVSSEKRDGE